jgi:death-on-curing protein
MIKHVSPQEVIALHDALIARYGGLPGTPDPGRVEALVGRVINHEVYEGVSDVYEQAGLYLVAIARGHVFSDGNKRTAFNAMMLFLRRNGIRFGDAPQWEDMTVKAATGELLPADVVQLLRETNQ